MKNFKTNAMLLSLGLLVSGSIMPAVQQAPAAPAQNNTQKTLEQQAKAYIQAIDTAMAPFMISNSQKNMFSPTDAEYTKQLQKNSDQLINTFLNIEKFVKQQSDFMSLKLTTGIKHCEAVLAYFTKTIIKDIETLKKNPNLKQDRTQDLINIAQLLSISKKELNTETYNSAITRNPTGKQAAKMVVLHLIDKSQTLVNQVKNDATQSTSKQIAPLSPATPQTGVAKKTLTTAELLEAAAKKAAERDQQDKTIQKDIFSTRNSDGSSQFQEGGSLARNPKSVKKK